MLFIILSKKNLKANHNEAGEYNPSNQVVYNIVKEKSESKSQQQLSACAACAVVYNIVKEKSESKSQRKNVQLYTAYYFLSSCYPQIRKYIFRIGLKLRLTFFRFSFNHSLLRLILAFIIFATYCPDGFCFNYNFIRNCSRFVSWFIIACNKPW